MRVFISFLLFVYFFQQTEFCNCVTYLGRELRGSMQDLSDVVWLTETSIYNAKMIDKKPRMTINVVVESVSDDISTLMPMSLMCLFKYSRVFITVSSIVWLGTLLLIC